MARFTFHRQRDKLSFNDKSRLVDALLACSTMKVKSERDFIIQEVSGDLGIRMPDNSDDHRVHTMNMVTTFYDYEGAIQLFFQVIRSQEQMAGGVASRPLLQINRVFGEVFGEIFMHVPNGLTNQHLDGLKHILDGVDFECSDVQSAFVQSMDGEPAPLCDRPDQAFNSMLWRAATRHDPCALVKFARNLARLKPAIKPRIEEWISQLGGDIPAVAALITAQPVSTAPIEQPCLQIAIDWREGSPREAREINDATPVRVIAVLCLNDHDHYFVNADAINLEAVPAFVQDAVRQSRERVQLQPIAIEVFLPLLLLKMHPVEQWNFNDDFDDSSWGYDYEIVVRSLDRIKSRPLRPNIDPHWMEKWQHLLDLQGRAVDGEPIITDENMVWVCSCVRQDIDAHSIKMKPATTVGAAVLVEVDRIPQVTYRSKLREFIHYVLLSGVPMAIWLRDAIDGMDIASIEGEFRQLIHTTPPHKLAARLRERRENASLDEVWWHIAHMWENPDRIAAELTPTTLNIQSARSAS